MKKFIFALALIALPLSAATYTPATSQQMEDFQKEVDQALAAEQKRVNDLLEEVAKSGKIMTANDKGDLRRLANELASKTVIVQNLNGSEVLSKSQAVRDALIALLKKQNLSPEDILQFQNTINKEKVKMNDLKDAPAPQAPDSL